MLSNGVTLLSYNDNHSKKVSFMGRRLPDPFKTYKSKYSSRKLKCPPCEDGPYGVLQKIQKRLIGQLESEAFTEGISVSELIAKKFGYSHKPLNFPIPSKTVKIQNMRVSSLIDGGQIFKKTIEYIDNAEKSIQVKMFEFQNLKVDGGVWPRNGAENVPGTHEQQRILEKLIAKRQSNPDMKIQLILDAHKWHIDGNGKKKRHYGNQEMIKYLKDKDIDVVFYPKDATLQHEKVLIVDDKKAIVGGMNWGNHSPANHDACLAIERTSGNSSSVDNLVEDFNTDWKFCWYKLGKKRFVDGPLNKEEQKKYGGINKEIKEENVRFYELLKDYFDTPEARNRYSQGKLDLVKANPVEDSPIKILRTKPRELEEIGDKGSEGILDGLMQKLKSAKKVRGQLFFFTDKDAVKTIIKRVHAGELDAKFIIEKNVFPYCENAYNELRNAGIDIRIYKGNKKTNQRMHAKWAVFDDEEVLLGSANWTSRGLRQNLKKGRRGDLPLDTEQIEIKIKDFINEVKPFEAKLHLPHIKWDGSENAYKDLIAAKKHLKSIYHKLDTKGEATFVLNGKKYLFRAEDSQIEVNGKKYSFKKSDDSTVMGEVGKVYEYYNGIQKKHLSKERYKRGNNEIALLVESPTLAKNVFTKQFELNHKHCLSNYEIEKMREIPDISSRTIGGEDL